MSAGHASPVAATAGEVAGEPSRCRALGISARRPIVRHLGLREYRAVWHQMQAYTETRGPTAHDQIWFVQHPPVYTLGLNGRREHVLAPGSIPVVPVDRGGQVTYHGPGQLVAYVLLDLHRLGLGIRRLVRALERAVIELLAVYGVEAYGRPEAPGVYVGGAKVAALGLRVRRGCTLHGLALNVRMDLEPYQRINPCGYAGLQVTELAALGGPDDLPTVTADLEPLLLRAIWTARDAAEYAGDRE